MWFTRNRLTTVGVFEEDKLERVYSVYTWSIPIFISVLICWQILLKMRVTRRYVEFWIHIVCDMVRGADCYGFDDDLEFEEEYSDWRKTTLVGNQEGTSVECYDWIDDSDSDDSDSDIDEDVEAEMYS